MKYYRLVFRDGSMSGWTKDYSRIREDAKFFHARIEVRELPQ